MNKLLTGVYTILSESPSPLRAEQITEELFKRQLWNSTSKTPVASVAAAIYLDIKNNSKETPFVKIDKNLFTTSTTKLEITPTPHPVASQPTPKTPPIKKGRPPKPRQAIEHQTFSFLDSAEKVLQSDAGRKPMHYTEITQRAIRYGWLVSNGNTPEASMSAQLYTDIKKCESQGRRSRFTMQKGMVGLTAWSASELEHQIENYNENQRKKLLEKVKTITPADFEKLITTLLSLMGFSSTERTPISSDHGVDVRGILEVHESINIRLAVQAKRWEQSVQAPVVRELRGSLRTDERGLIVTTSTFSDGAKKEASRTDAHAPIDLINGKQLVDLLVAYNLGVSKNRYQLLELTDSFFDDDDTK